MTTKSDTLEITASQVTAAVRSVEYGACAAFDCHSSRSDIVSGRGSIAPRSQAVFERSDADIAVRGNALEQLRSAAGIPARVFVQECLISAPAKAGTDGLKLRARERLAKGATFHGGNDGTVNTMSHAKPTT